ncbi:MAG: heterodisulfide reductase-related iron-sulfur binding cluster [candidate division WOR-3 bacterium]
MTEYSNGPVLFACHWALAELSEQPRLSPDHLKKVTCIGQVSAGQILQVLEEGAERVILLGCSTNRCRHQTGPNIAESQVRLLQRLTTTLGLGSESVKLLLTDQPETKALLASFANKKKPQRRKARSARMPSSHESKAQPPEPELLRLCQDCGRCSGICPVSRTGLGFSPRRLIQTSIQSGSDALSNDRALFACLGCDLCALVCPSEIRLSTLMPELRRQNPPGALPATPAHAGLPHTLMRLMARSPVPQNRLSWLDQSCETSPQGDTLLFVGCVPYFEPIFESLHVSPLTTVRNTIRLLNRANIRPVLLPDERCCGHDLNWLGDTENFLRLAEQNLSQIRASGARRVVFLCPECQRTFQLDYNRHFGPLEFETWHITQLLAQELNITFAPMKLRVTYHDPCRLGRHLGIYEPPRSLLRSVPELEFVEMARNRTQATCCGGTAWVECGAAAKLLQAERLAEASATGARLLITACSKCNIHFSCALEGDSRNSIKLRHIVDFLAESAGLAENLQERR